MKVKRMSRSASLIAPAKTSAPRPFDGMLSGRVPSEFSRAWTPLNEQSRRDYLGNPTRFWIHSLIVSRYPGANTGQCAASPGLGQTRRA
jgi:hypothetical protein